MSDKKDIIFSVTRKDLVVEYFRGSGAGGQKRNKTSSACRIKHPASGAVGEAQEERMQHVNKEVALRRMVDSRRFRMWVRAQAAAIEQGHRDLATKIEKEVASAKVEYTTTWTCDKCKRTEKLVSEDSTAKPDWIVQLGSKDLCEACDENS